MTTTAQGKRGVQALNETLHALFAERDDVVLFGEDVLDPYGGAFKVTQGLSDAYPDRVLTTPISEASLFGVAAGMALRGQRPILEIMFGDFVALGLDQIVNGISKFREMYDDQVTVPLVVRTPRSRTSARSSSSRTSCCTAGRSGGPRTATSASSPCARAVTPIPR